jgi:hypothetical protein
MFNGRTAWAMLAMAACGGGGGSGGGDAAGGGGDRFGEFIFVDVEATGDFSGFTAGEDFESTTWLTQTVNPALAGGSFDVVAFVEDFESGDPVDAATVDVYYADRVQGAPDVSAVSDSAGDLRVASPACQALTYKVTTDPILAETRTTYEAHQVFPHPGEGNTEITGFSFLSVSTVTYQLIPTILGVTVDPDKAVIAGTAYDVARDAGLPSDDDAGKVEGAQVIVYDESGNIPDSLVVNYFVDDFPDRDQKWTSADGLWVASNVPPGNLRVEMWGQVDGVLTLLGATQVYSEANGINISNIYAGYGDGVKYPSSCL